MTAASAMVSAIILMAATCGDAGASPISNDGYPPPGGVTFLSAGAGAGKAGGRTWSFSNLDFSAFGQLWYGMNSAFLPKIAMNIGPGFTAGEQLVFSAVDSNLAGRIAVWTGTSGFTFNVPNNVTENIPVRFFEHTARHRSVFRYLTGSRDRSDRRLLRQPSRGSLHGRDMDATWTPVNDLFDAENTLPSDGARTDFGTSFYSTVPEPGSLALLVLGALGAGLLRGRSRGRRAS